MYQEVIKLPAGGKAIRVVHFDSVDDFVTPRLDNPQCNQIFIESVDAYWKAGHAGGTSLNQWFGCSTKEEFSDTLNKGHPRYADMVLAQDVLAPEPQRLKRRRVNGDFGDEVCIHRINSGNAMSSWSRKLPRVRVGIRNIRLIVNIGNNCGTTAQQLQWIGVAALRLANAFEIAGYSVAIDLFQGTADITRTEHIVQIAPIKDYGNRMDIQQLSSVVCFAGFFRGPGFINKGLAQGPNFMFSGLGRSLDNSIQLEVVSKYYTNPSEAVEFITRDVLDEKTAEREVERILKKYAKFEEAAA